MQIIYIFLIFSLVLFLYLHVYFHLKTSNDLEVYDLEQPPAKDKLEEICDLRQPVLFKYPVLQTTCQRQQVLDNYGAFDVKIRNVKAVLDETSELYVPLAFSTAMQAIDADRNASYVIENNADFLDETGLSKQYKYNDGYLRPYMVSKCSYDYITGSDETQTPLRYDLNYRNYYVAVEGEVKVKLIPPKYTRYLHLEKDYETLEFRSPINPKVVQVQYKQDYDKVKSINVVLKEGHVLQIPAYWWYSFELGKNTTVCAFKYRTYMNTIAVAPHLIMTLLQTQNVKRRENISLASVAAIVTKEPSSAVVIEPSSTVVIEPSSKELKPTEELEISIIQNSLP